MSTGSTSRNYVFEDLFNSIRITIQTNKRWGWFLPSLFIFVMNGFCALPILGLMLAGIAQKYLPKTALSLVLFLIVALFIYILYKKLLETLEHLFDKEVVEIDDYSIKIERSGFLGFKNRRTYLAESINGIALSFPLFEQFGFLNRLPLVSPKNIGSFVIWEKHKLKAISDFGRGISQEDAQTIIESVYRKFPKYRYVGTS